MENNVYSVSNINKYIKMVFDKDTFLNNVRIKGEITNFKPHYSGHMYFTLKDQNSTIKCVMFKGYAESLKFKLSDGQSVIITGQISTFERDGVYQVYAKSISIDGLGDLYLKYEQLKAKLQDEGLFDEKYKKQIPFLPSKVGVITSRTGSVVRDIINVTTRRYDNVYLSIYPAAVQGENTARTVIEGIKAFNREEHKVDCIIIARGGGSFEDLFGFNDENLARAIFESKIPIISAVGHETDFTICDFVSDLRAPTPSAAAELVYPTKVDLLSRIDICKVRLNRAITVYIDKRKQYLHGIKSQKLEKTPRDIISKNMMIVDSSVKHLQGSISRKYENIRHEFEKYTSLLDSYSPLKTLSRGYSVTQNSNGQVVSSVKDVKTGEQMTVRLTDGSIVTKVEDIK